MPKQARKSTTLDNGTENMLHTKLNDDLSMQTYFADPYSSWQRGANEYTNGFCAAASVNALISGR
jgi:transposase, IS30 family